MASFREYWASWLRWDRGRQGTGYDKLLLAANPLLIPFDLYLLRYPVGSHIPPHRDPVPAGRHYRLNVVVRRSPSGGAFVCDNPIYASERINFFRSDVSTHSVTKVEGRPRYVLSLGWILRQGLPAEARTMNLQNSRIGQIAITVSDVPRALAFYRDILGLKFLFAPAPTLAFLQAGDTRLMLSTPQGSGAVGANSILYFTTTDIESTHASLVAAGATNERAPQLAAPMPDHDLWLGFLRDPDGNLVGLMEEKRRAHPPQPA